jgi:DnaJ-domain-containing protein 1
MIYLALGFAVLALLTWVGRSGLTAKTAVRTLQWRFLAGGLSVAAFAAAAYLTIEGGWGKGIVLFVLGLWMATLVRTPRAQPRAGGSVGGKSEPVGLSEARAILGVAPDASREEIEDAYKRLMRRAHPDQGGTTGLAAQLNAARDRLLRG